MKKQIILLLFVYFNLSAQTQKIDSLKNNVLKKDSNSIKNLRKIGSIYLNEGNYDSSIKYYQKSLILSQLIEDVKQEALSIKFFGKYYLLNGKYDSSKFFYNKAITIFEKVKNQSEIADCYFYIGRINATQSNYVVGLDYFYKAIKINKVINNNKNYIKCLNAIGIIYNDQSKFDLAIKTLAEAIKTSQDFKIDSELNTLYSNIGYSYLNKNLLDSAIKYQLLTLKIGESTNNKNDISIACINLANSYYSLNKFDRTREYCDLAENILVELGDDYALAEVYHIKGILELELKNYAKAKIYFNKILDIGIKTNVVSLRREAYEGLSNAEYELRNYKVAYIWLIKFKKITDSIFNIDNSKQLGDLKTNFEVEKKEAELKIKADAEKQKFATIANEEKKQHKIIIFSVASVLTVVCVFSIFLYRRFKLTQKQKYIIEAKEKETQFQKQIIEEKQKEILDSIRYAKRIQEAHLPNEQIVLKTIKRLTNKKP